MIRIAASSLVLGTMLFVGAAQAEPAKLTAPQMDQVTAGFLNTLQINVNFNRQLAFAAANACRQAGCNGQGNRSGGSTVAAAAQADNYNTTTLINIH